MLYFACSFSGYACNQEPAVIIGINKHTVLWKVTPLFAEWISSPNNPLTANGILSPSSSVLELGCGISGVIALCLAPQIARYTLTDQPYVLKLIRQNLEENAETVKRGSGNRKGGSKSKKGDGGGTAKGQEVMDRKIRALALDWETDEVSNVVSPGESFDVVVACDCIYNSHLIPPIVSTCVDACKLRKREDGEPTVCIVGQQLRSDEVFESWLREFSKNFKAYRVPDSMLIDGLKEDSGFVVHIGVLREELQE